MKRLLCVLMLAGVVAGCGKERFTDPQEFAEHYGQELLGDYFKSGMELMAYKGFEFSNAKVGIDRAGREYVSAQVSLIVPRGENYYYRLEPPSAEDTLKTWPSDRLSVLAGQGVEQAIKRAYHEVRQGRYAPIVYSASPVDIRKFVSPWRTIRIIRLKDGEGVYHPVGDIKRAVKWYAANGDEMSEVASIPMEPFYGEGSGLLSETAIKRFRAVKNGTPEAAQARESYDKWLAGIEIAIRKLNACCVTQSEILAVAPSYASTDSLPMWIWNRRTKEEANVQKMINSAENSAISRNREAQNAVRSVQTAIGRLKSQVAKAEREVSLAKRNLEADTKQLEHAATATRSGRPLPPRRTKWLEQLQERVTTSGPKAVADAEAALAALQAEAQSAEAALAEAKANQTRIAEEGQTAIAKAKAEGKKSMDKAVKRLQAEYQVLKQKSSAELEKAIEDCKRLLGLER